MDTPDREQPEEQNPNMQCVEVILWGIYFLRQGNHLLSTLSCYAVDRRTITKGHEPEKIYFHFAQSDWEKTLRPLLVENSIPFVVGKDCGQCGVLRAPRKKVYVVEGDLELLFTLNNTLEQAGYDVTLSHSAKRLMEGEVPPTDLFILDKSMQDGDGLDIYYRLRSRIDTRNTPVIMLSSLGSVQPTSLPSGVNDILSKPFEMGDLLQMVTKHTGMVC